MWQAAGKTGRLECRQRPASRMATERKNAGRNPAQGMLDLESVGLRGQDLGIEDLRIENLRIDDLGKSGSGEAGRSHRHGLAGSGRMKAMASRTGAQRLRRAMSRACRHQAAAAQRCNLKRMTQCTFRNGEPRPQGHDPAMTIRSTRSAGAAASSSMIPIRERCPSFGILLQRRARRGA